LKATTGSEAKTCSVVRGRPVRKNARVIGVHGWQKEEYTPASSRMNLLCNEGSRINWTYVRQSIGGGDGGSRASFKEGDTNDGKEASGAPSMRCGVLESRWGEKEQISWVVIKSPNGERKGH